MYDPRKLYCPTCHEEFESYGVKHKYRHKLSGELVDWKDAHLTLKDYVQVPICKKGHAAYYIGMTTKECPICHTVGQPIGAKGKFDPKSGRPYGEWSQRPENEPCKDCNQEIFMLRNFRAETIKANAALEAWTVESYPRFWIQDANVQEYHDLENGFREMCLVVGRPAAEEKSKGFLPTTTQKEQRSSGRMLFTPDGAAAIQRVYDGFMKCLKATAAYNLERGRSLLIQLAEGRITGGAYEAGRLKFDNEE